MEKQLNISGYLSRVGVGNYCMLEIKITSINSAANYHEKQFFQKDH